MCSVSAGLPVLELACERKPVMCALSCPVSFTQRCLEARLCPGRVRPVLPLPESGSPVRQVRSLPIRQRTDVGSFPPLTRSWCCGRIAVPGSESHGHRLILGVAKGILEKMHLTFSPSSLNHWWLPLPCGKDLDPLAGPERPAVFWLLPPPRRWASWTLRPVPLGWSCSTAGLATSGQPAAPCRACPALRSPLSKLSLSHTSIPAQTSLSRRVY